MGTENDVLGESLTDAEAAYFTSKGEKTEQLAQDTLRDEPERVIEPSEPMQPEATDAEPPPGQVDDEEGVYIDEDGKARSVLTGKFVPHAALHKERERRKAIEQENLTYREKVARVEERLAVLNEVMAAVDGKRAAEGEVSKPDTPPNPEEDIFAYVKYLEQRVNKTDEERQSFAKQTQERQAREQLTAMYRQDALRFAEQAKDFGQAYSYLQKSKTEELTALGFSPQEIQRQLEHEELTAVTRALQARRSPAEAVYQAAKARGWRGEEAATAAPVPQQNGAQKLQTIERAKQTQRTLSGAGGSSGEGLTAEALANMSDDEFAAVAAKMGKSKMRPFLGG